MCLKSVLFVAALVIWQVDGFNVETFNYALFEGQGQGQSMFGFTVAVHREGSQPWVLVGAPEEQSRYQRGIHRGGVVYKCHTDRDSNCEEIPFDTLGNHVTTSNQDIDNKTMQWFGATLSASGRDSGPIVACAPRYVWYTKDLNRKDPVGTCYVSDGYFRNFEEYSPCRTIHWGYHRQGSCQAGFSAAINNEGDRLFVGAPGSYYWQGQMYSIDAHAKFNFTPGIVSVSYGGKGSVFQQSLEKRPAVFSTQEGKQVDDDSYMGYSTVSGDFLSDGEEGIVVGMPRGAELQGKVLFFTWNLTNYKNISSNKIGSYFGYSLGAADVDGDGRLDLIVGAPMHTEPNNEGKYDVGRVYVFYQGDNRFDTFNDVDTLDGTNSKGRFGLSVSTLGDLNQDGFDDFAVGAPYDGPNGRGAVYIYYGSSEGVLEKYGQVIYAEELKTNYPVQTFGFSVTGGLDMDGNEYPDLAVGAYLSDTAFFFRSRPVVRVEAAVKFLTRNNQIDIEKSNCNLNGNHGTCTDIEFCVKYGGKGIPSSIVLNLQYLLDTKTKGPARMVFYDLNKSTFNETIELRKDTPKLCVNKRVFIQSDIRDKLTPLEAAVNYFMTENRQYYGLQRNPQSPLQPTIDLNSPPTKKDAINIQKNCGSDNICTPDLQLEVTSNVQKYLLGSNTNLEFDVIVNNRGEDAFETTFELQYPEGIYYKKVENNRILCSLLENRTIQCQIGNPLPAEKIASFRLLFQPFHKHGMAPSYEFDMYVNSTNPDDKWHLEDNHKHMSIDIWIDASLDLSGVSYPREVQYNASRYSATSKEIRKESDIGPQVVHVYNLRNKGPATIEKADIYILWPMSTLSDDDLLYLLDQPATIGDVQCQPVQANYKNYQLDFHSKSIWERLEIDTSASEFTNSEALSGKDYHIESGKGIQASIGGTKVKQERKLDKEIAGSSGDASVVHQKRLNSTYTSTHTYTHHGVPYRNVTNTTTIRDGSGNIINQFSNSRVFKGQEEDARRFYGSGNYQPKIVYSSSGGGQSGQGSFSQFEESSYSGHSTTSGQGQSQGQSAQFGASSVHGAGQSEGTIPQHEGSYFRQENRAQLANRGSFDEDRRQQAQGGYSSNYEGNYESRQSQSGGRQQGQSGQSRGQSGDGSTSYGYEESGTFTSYGSGGQFGTRNQAGSGGGQYSSGSSYSSQSGGSSGTQSGQSRGQSSERHYSAGTSTGGQYSSNSGRLYGVTSGTQSGSTNSGGQYSGNSGQSASSGERHYSSSTNSEGHYSGGGQYSGNSQGQYSGHTEGQYGTNSGQSGNRHYSITGGQYSSSNQEGQNIAGQNEGHYSGGSRYHIQARPGGKKITITGRYEQTGSGENIDGTQSQSGETQYSSHREYSYGNKNVQDNVIQHGHQEPQGQRHRHRGGQVVNGQFRAYAQNGSEINRQGGTQAFDLNSGSQGFGEQAAIGHGFTFNTMNLGGGIQAHTDTPQFKTVQHSEVTIERTGDIPPNYYPNRPANRDNVATDRPDLSNPVHRGKRQAVPPEIADVIKCNSTKCYYIKCTVGVLKKDKEVSIALRSRVNVRAIEKMSTTQPIKFSSMMLGSISQLPYIGKPREQILHSHEIFTEVPAQEQEVKPYVIPLWVVVLSAVAGTLALLLIIYLFYKCGFFKRNRPPTAPERQPLNRNGYHNGDEAL